VNRKVGYLMMLVIAGIWSCALPPGTYGPGTRTSAPQQKTDRLVSPKQIQDRIEKLRGIMDQKDLTERERRVVMRFIELYRSMERSVSRPGPDQALVDSLYPDLERLERACLPDEKISAASAEEHIRGILQQQEKILDRYLSQDFNGVIRQSLELKEAFGPDALTPQVGLLFSLSLAREGMLKEAIRVGNSVVDEIELSPDPVYLKVKMAEWHLALDQPEEAREWYDKLTDHLDQWRSDIAALEERLPSGSAPLPSQEVGEEPAGSPELKEEARNLSLNELLERVDRLIRHARFDQAKLLLIRRRIALKDPSDVELIDRALENVNQAEETRQARIGPGADRCTRGLESAKALVEAEDYRTAIRRLDALPGACRNDPEVKILRERAVEKWVQHERNRAARLFLAAKNSQSPGTKRSRLRSCLKILNKLIEQYPTSSLKQKIKSDKKVVTEALERLP